MREKIYVNMALEIRMDPYRESFGQWRYYSALSI